MSLEDQDLGQEEAVARINHRRAAAGLPPLEVHPKLHLAAANHASYLAANQAFHRANNLSLHDEEDGRAGFTGVSPGARAAAAGYAAPAGVWEDLAFKGSAAGAVDAWMNTVYHRVALLLPQQHHVGFAALPGDAGPQEVLDLAELPGMDAPELALWPPAGAQDMPTAFDGLETPVPRVPPFGWPSGAPVSVVFQERSHDGDIHVTTSSITVDGEDLEHTVLTPGLDGNLFSSIFLYTHRPLPELATVHVNIQGHGPRAALQLDWTFTTACGAESTHGVRCNGNVLERCGPTALVEEDCQDFQCISLAHGAACAAMPPKACAAPDGTRLGCAGTQALLHCESATQARTRCPQGTTCQGVRQLAACR